MALFFNTIGIESRELRDAIAKASVQNEIVKLIFQDKKEMTPFECHKIYLKVKKNTPITSIRRAINTLTEKGYLVKTTTMRKGEYDKDNHVWKLRGK